MNENQLSEHLKETFGYKSFREGQEAIIEDVLNGRDVLGILPTGTGKSICYQLPAKLLPGVTVVVSPLISLMMDQVKQLKAKGYKSVIALNSFMDKKERVKAISHLDRYDLIYVSPEILQNKEIKKSLLHSNVRLFVIDEAHCISQWGHEFRTDYLKLHHVIEEFGSPTVLALSATATPEVQDDIIEKLNRPKMKKRIYSMDKPNISFSVEHHNTPEEKVKRLIDLLSTNHSAVMIYFSSRQWAEKVAYELHEKLEQEVAFYHGGMEQTDRMLVQQQFMNDQLDIICCTSAFGMGVDKRNIRLVVHFHIPSQLESFIQEVGRAGRDGLASVSLVLYAPKDHYLPQMLIQNELPEQSDIHNVLSKLNSYYNQLHPLPEDSVILEENQLSESQWNFLKYQLEELTVLKDNDFLKSPNSKQIIEQIIDTRDRRWLYKQNKLTEMIHWIQISSCRRVQLYQPFQEGFQSPVVKCCDACGFRIEQVEFDKSHSNHRITSWEKRLADIFGQRVLDE